MKLLRVGATTVNLDRVNHIDDNEDQITITFDNSVPYPQGSITINTAEEVDLLRHWLRLHVENISEMAEDSTGAPLGKPKNYISPR